jgi:hypothetical protein
MNTLVNTVKYQFVSANPLFILNLTTKKGAMRPVAYFAVKCPREGSQLSSPMLKQNTPIYNDDGDVRMVVQKHIDHPCGDSFQPNFSDGVVEVPCHSVYDVNNDIKDKYHNLYTTENRKHAGAFTSDPVSPIMEFIQADKTLDNFQFVSTATLFRGIASDGSDIVDPIYSKDMVSEDDDADTLTRADTVMPSMMNA